MQGVPSNSDEIWLRDNESLLSVHPSPIVRPPKLPSPVAALAQLTGVETIAAIGTRPPLAATLLEGNATREARLFEALFGRDALTISRFVRDDWPALTTTTLIALAELQGLPFEAAPHADLYTRRLEQPGRIPHETREASDPIARDLIQRMNWAFPYFHSDDATPMFVRDLAQLALHDSRVLAKRIVQRDGVERSLADALGAGVAHIVASLSPEGTLLSARGPAEQASGLHSYPVWQDSPDAYFRTNGDLARNSIAALEVQVYTYDALHAIERLVRRYPTLQARLGTTCEIAELADAVHRSVHLQFWVASDGGYFAPAVEKVGNQFVALGGRKSNMGALLDSAILSDGPVSRGFAAVVHAMFDREHEMVTPWGIRTLSPVGAADHYRPDAYHNGSIWLFDNHVMARGLHRHGWHGLAHWLNRTLVAACDELSLYPEYIRGDSSEHPRITEYVADVIAIEPDGLTRHTRIAQPPQPVQGWTVAAYLGAQRAIRKYPAHAYDARTRRVEEQLLDGLRTDRGMTFGR
ncbi:MAG: amylo-alpha-1,6-glucosidase [Acidimicrobiia bacterium]